MMKYPLRRNIMPKNFMEGASLLATLILLPVICFFELFVILPLFHQPGTFIYYILWIAALFILFNAYGNFVYCILMDTSIRNVILMPPTEEELRRHWRFCLRCELLAPPRSWHCNICNICILKRDHHCIFTAYCVGHRNQRYFFMFVTYVFLGGFIAFCYNSIYIWSIRADTYCNLRSLVKMLAPFVTLFMDVSLDNFYLILYEINMMSLGLAMVMFFYHGRKLLNGSVMFECCSTKYDLGLKKNLSISLGKRWHLIWLCPFIHSELTHDGIYWEELLQSSMKNR